MTSKAVPQSEMTEAKQLTRAQELYTNASLENLKDLILMSDADNTTYILYGIKNDTK